MGKKISIEIGDRSFATKSKAKEFIRTILYRYSLGSPLKGNDLAFINELLENHPNSEVKIGVGVSAIIVEMDSLYGTTRHFSVVRIDGTKIDFSYDSALTPSRDEPIKLFMRAARCAIADQVISFRDEFFRANADTKGNIPCPITGILIGKNESHIDHIYPESFDKIASDFISRNDIDVDIVKFIEPESGIGRVFADKALREAFSRYHLQVAKLRVTSIKGNLEQKRKVP